MKHSTSAALIVAVTITAPSFTLGGERDKAVAMVNYYAKYEARTEERQQRGARSVESQFALFKQADDRLEWVDVDIFLPASKAQRDRYQRIVIPFRTDWFTMPMYEGMLDYVRSGGLLITQTSGVLVDKSENYRQDDSTTSDFMQVSVLGMRAVGGTTITRVKRIDRDSPLTREIEPDQWLTLVRPSGSRCTTNIQATVVMVSQQTCDDQKNEGPFLSHNAIGQGACIYIAGSIYNADDPVHMQIAKNVLSEETLAALCAQGREQGPHQDPD